MKDLQFKIKKIHQKCTENSKNGKRFLLHTETRDYSFPFELTQM